MKPGSIQPNQHVFFIFISTEGLFFIQQIVLAIMLLQIGLGPAGGKYQRLTSLQEKDVVRELMLANQVLEQISGKTPVLFRPPYGSFNQRMAELAWEQGLRTVTWSVDPQDWKGPGVETLARKVVSRTKAGDIILLHEGKSETLAALSMIISGIQAKGLVFVSASTLLGKTGSLAH